MLKDIWNFGYKHQHKIWWFTAIGFTLLAIGFFIDMDIHSYNDLNIIAKIGWVTFLIGMGIGLLRTVIQFLFSYGKRAENIIKNK